MTRAPGAAAAGGALVLLAAAFAVPALYVPGVALLILAAAAWAAVSRPARALRLRRTPAGATVVEGGAAQVTLSVARGLFPPPGRLRTAAGVAVDLRRAARAPVTVRVSVPRRGRHHVVPGSVDVGDPFGMVTRRRDFPAVELLGLPRVEPVEFAGGLAAGADAGGLRVAANTAALEVDGLRPHRPGSPASRIHWPAVARTGTLVERRLSDEAERLPLVVLDPQRPAGEDELDAALRAAASLCVHLAGQGGCSLLLPGERRGVAVGPDLHGWSALHARLALVQAGEVPGAAAINRSGVLLWVTARRSGLPPALARAGAGERYLVSPFGLAGRRASFLVAGCSGVRLRSAGEARAA